jgi:hypothetical protein
LVICEQVGDYGEFSFYFSSSRVPHLPFPQSLINVQVKEEGDMQHLCQRLLLTLRGFMGTTGLVSYDRNICVSVKRVMAYNKFVGISCIAFKSRTYFVVVASV